MKTPLAASRERRQRAPKRSFLSLCLATTLLTQQAVASSDLLNMSLEELMNIKITSVSKKTQQLTDAAAAIHVITSKDILKSGATSIAETLKMVPGMQVAQVDANKWAISARGYNSRFANKLLVLIDGRSVYSPTYSGVYWDALDVVLEDVERIEVIRGPGAALWGSNAVNGVINIITKSAAETKGKMAIARVTDNDGSTAIFRQGGAFTESTDYRVYAKYEETGDSQRVIGGNSKDASFMRQAGFRVDAAVDADNQLTLQGDTYSSTIDQDRIDQTPDISLFGTLMDDPVEQRGSNLLARWNHTTPSNGKLAVQLFLDHYSRQEGFMDEQWDTVDLDIQYSTTVWDNHNLTMGGGHRYKKHSTKDTGFLAFQPKNSDHENSNLFIQDQISFLQGRANLYLGTKVEHNELAIDEWELQPNIRASYRINDSSMVWASIAKAIRTPSRVEQEASAHLATAINGFPGLTSMPLVIRTIPMKGMKSEELLAYEMGFRASLTRKLFIDAAIFYNDYSKQRSLELIFDSILPYPLPPAMPEYLELGGTFANNDQRSSRGLELAFEWALTESWSVKGNYSYITQSEEQEFGLILDLSNHPSEHMFNLFSSHRLSKNLTLDAWIRYVDGLTDTEIDNYTTLDLRLAWQPVNNLELSLVGKNLFGEDNQQYVQEIFLSPDAEISPEVHAQVTWKF